jgi:hypothetical protein
MKSSSLFVLTAAAALAGASARGADMRPMTLEDFSGQLRIHQPLPGTCETVDLTVPAIDGRMEIAPGEDVVGYGNQMFFELRRAQVSFAPFTVHRSCMLQDVTRVYSSVKVSLGRAVPMTATNVSSHLYIVIPKDEVVIQQAVVVNGQLEIGETKPLTDVYGFISEGGQVSISVTVRSRVEGHDGTITATLTARRVPADYDRDGVPNWQDNCRLVPNPTQVPVVSPVVVTPPDRTLGSCAHALEYPAAADVCRGQPLTITHDAPPKLPKGLTTVNWRIRDAFNHTTTTTQRITVVDRTPPAFLAGPTNVTLPTCGPATLTPPTPVEDCDASVSLTSDAPASFPLLPYPTVVTWTAQDSSGNRGHLQHVVSVVDTTRPSASCSLQSQTDELAGLYQVGAADACGLASLKLGPYDIAPGETIELAFTNFGTQVTPIVPAPHGVRAFSVSAASGRIEARDGSGNKTLATCRALLPPPDPDPDPDPPCPNPRFCR